MRKKYMLIGVVGVVVGVLLSSAVFVLAGNVDSPGAPGATNSFALDDIYNRLDSGADGAQSTFTEPGVAPGTGTMHTLNQIMAQAPALDNTNGATETNVLDGKTFWGLTGGQWGLQTGDIPTQTVSNTTVSQLAGYYDAFDLSTVDADLASGNVKSGVSIYGVAGDPNVVNTSSGDAAAGDIKDGKKAWVAGAEVTGNIATQTVDNTTVSQLAGYYDAFDLSTVDADLASGNVKSGVSIYGVAGDPNVVNTSSGDAAAGEILINKKAWVDGAEVTGTMPDNEGDNASTPQAQAGGVNYFTAPQGYYDGNDRVSATDAQVAALDADITAGNIVSDTVIFGVVGTYPWAPVPKTGQTKCYTAAASSEEDCPETNGNFPGQDGDHQKGVAWPVPRFTKNNGTVTDNLTELIWLKDANCIKTQYPGYDAPNADGEVTWREALQFVAGINGGTYSDCRAGHTDWRLPNVREMQSLVHYGVDSPAVPDTAGTGQWSAGDPFDNVKSGPYWSSTTYAHGTAGAWYVGLSYGTVVNHDKDYDKYVWPARGKFWITRMAKERESRETFRAFRTFSCVSRSKILLRIKEELKC